MWRIDRVFDAEREVNGKRSDEARLPARGVIVLGRPWAGSFGLTLWLTFLDDAKGGEYRRVEVLTGPSRRRKWLDDDKARIVAETLDPGAVVVEVARRWQVCSQQVFTWRREMRAGAAARLAFSITVVSTAISDRLRGVTAPEAWPASMVLKQQPLHALFADAAAPAAERRRVNGLTVLEEDLTGEVLEVRVLHPAGEHRLVGKVEGVL